VVQLCLFWVTIVGQGHRSEFKVTGGNVSFSPDNVEDRRTWVGNYK